jgi:predicted MPP superfamily phosphohydrolase
MSKKIRSFFFPAATFVLLDFYVFQGVLSAIHSFSAITQSGIIFSYWIISLVAVLVFTALMQANMLRTAKPGSIALHLFAMVVGLYIAKVVAGVFLLTDDIRRVAQGVFQLVGSSAPGLVYIGRSSLMSLAGLASGFFLYVVLLLGFNNKYRYKLHRHTLRFTNLPVAFNGIKIIQLSDIHSGSLANRKAVQQGLDLIMEAKPDLILFTGDLVNDHAQEMHDYIDVFSQLGAPLGVYSILGNHDYGDYVTWASAAHKQHNLQHLKQIHADMGWRLLLNEHTVLERNGEQIALLGVENWGAKGFAQYGDLEKTYRGSEKYVFKLLMSHDPSHWEAQVLPSYPDIDLTLSGHTHGMQFGFENSFFRFSPVQWVYKQWAGLYERASQKLYVNRGFGFIGYQGRVGILPEITLLELIRG